MNIKYFIPLFFILTVQRNASAQKAKDVLYIIYVDNNNPEGDGLSGSMISDMTQLMEDSIKDHRLLFFLSDRKTSQVTDNISAANRIIDGLTAKNTAFPDQGSDVILLRNKLVSTLKNFKGDINIIFYVTDRLVSSLQDKYSPLFGLFPKELAHLYSADISHVTVRINYPVIKYSRVNEEEVKNALNFSAAGKQDPAVNYLLTKFK